ncbi:MAG TPA: hypothetical protein VLB74_09365 [Flavobacterium sp.]|uniref:hypothetical protein n=1 Tax=Flavobacterium sp. TaxID=239 RepID=UPI002BA1F46A|nr:hypothetical protein [Flavobacterium sp.]HSD14842.1 hypothetical protein [Flavobacterium sp.]
MKKLMSLLILAAATVACTDDDIRTEQDFSNGPKVVGFASSFESVAYFEDLGAVERTFPVTMIGTGNGQNSATPINVHYEIDPASTATEGVEFDFVDQSGIVTIQPNATFGNFPLLVNTGQLNPDTPTELILNLVSADGAVVGSQYHRLRIVFVGCQSQIADQDGENYMTRCTRNDGFVRNFPAPEPIYMVDVNTFKTTTTATYLPGSLPVPDQGYNFIDICGDITVPHQNLAQGSYGNEVYGLTDDGTDGYFIDANTFEIIYEVTFAAGNRQYTSRYTRIN